MIKIAIASGKGGTGKTMVSTNLFQTWVQQNTNTYLIDCDAEEPNVNEFIKGTPYASREIKQDLPVIDHDKCTFCGACSASCTYNAIISLPAARFIDVVNDLCDDCGACYKVCPAGAITATSRTIGRLNFFKINDHAHFLEARMETGIFSPVPVIKKAAVHGEEASIVLLDSPPGTSCPFIVTVYFADYVLLVTEPTPFGLHDLKLSVEVVREMNKPFGVIVNKANSGNREVYSWMESENITLIGEIPYDMEIARTYSKGNLVINEHPAYKQIFVKIAEHLQSEVELSLASLV